MRFRSGVQIRHRYFEPTAPIILVMLASFVKVIEKVLFFGVAHLLEVAVDL
jgi:hypothetical protein